MTWIAALYFRMQGSGRIAHIPNTHCCWVPPYQKVRQYISSTAQPIHVNEQMPPINIISFSTMHFAARLCILLRVNDYLPYDDLMCDIYYFNGRDQKVHFPTAAVCYNGILLG
jgi:hypothetical protein